MSAQEWLGRFMQAARVLGWPQDAADELWRLAHEWALGHVGRVS